MYLQAQVAIQFYVIRDYENPSNISCFFLLFSQQVYTQDKETELETIQINCNSDEFYDLKSNKNKKTMGEFSLNIVISDTLVNNGKFTVARAYGKAIVCDDFFGPLIIPNLN